MATTTNDDILAMLRNVDLRLHVLELYVNRQQRRGLALPGKLKRPRGRPRGSKSLPRIRVGEALFDEHKLSVEQLAQLRVIESWVRLSIPHREVRLLSSVVGDASRWEPPPWANRDPTRRAWLNLCSLWAYADACGERAALKEVLRHIERQPVEDVASLRRGLDIVEEMLTTQSSTAA